MKLRPDEEIPASEEPSQAPTRPPSKSKFRQESQGAKPSAKLRSKARTPPTTKADKNITKAQARFDKASRKRDDIKSRFSKQRSPKPDGLFKGAVLLAAQEGRAKFHGKLSEAERENVGVEASHRSELVGERTAGSAHRFIRRQNSARGARELHKWENKTAKAGSKLRFEQAVKDHPELKSKAVRHAVQKKALQKQFQTRAQTAVQNTAQTTVQKAGGAAMATVKKIGRALTTLVKSNPKVILVMAVGIFLLIVVMQSCVGLVSTFSNSIGGAIGAATFPSEDEEMLAAEEAYAGMEAELQYELDNYPALHPGYDEYIFELDDIGHDPYVLIALLTVIQEGPWTLGEVWGILLDLFEAQYLLTETVEVEERYYTETIILIDLETGEEYTESVEVPYEYFICTVTLENVGLSNLVPYYLSDWQLDWYTLLMATLGNRPDLFPSESYPNSGAP